jgi:hypothetical protein
MSAPLEIRPLREGDEESLLATFEAAFGRGLSLETWRWAFRQNPAGTQVQVALRGDRVVAQYAALPNRVWMDGQERVFSQVVDSMVHPDERGGLGRQGTFARTARSFFDEHGLGGPGGGEVSMFYGWPVPANRRIGERLLGYERCGRQLALVRALEQGTRDATRSRASLADLDVEELSSFDERALWLWERCAPEMGAGTVRDGAWLLWRYLRHPEHTYSCLGLCDSQGILRGLAVGRAVDHDGKRVALVADWLVPSAEPQVGQQLLKALVLKAREWDCETLALWMPPVSNWFTWFQAQGFALRPTPWQRVVRSFDRRVDMEFVQTGWWYQLGDSDLV